MDFKGKVGWQLLCSYLHTYQYVQTIAGPAPTMVKAQPSAALRLCKDIWGEATLVCTVDCWELSHQPSSPYCGTAYSKVPQIH